MGREIRRVPLDFDWPIDKVWEGFLMPDSLSGNPCPDCKNGYSPRGQYLHDLWYGYVSFKPEDNGSTPFGQDHPIIQARAKNNVERACDFYIRPGETESSAIAREAHRLASLFNHAWSHHLNQDDVDALVEGNRLWDFTKTFIPGEGWKAIEPRPEVTALQVRRTGRSGGRGPQLLPGLSGGRTRLPPGDGVRIAAPGDNYITAHAVAVQPGTRNQHQRATRLTKTAHAV